MLSRLLAIVAIVVSIASCGSKPNRVRRPGEEYLARIELEGNASIETDALVRGLALHRTQQGGRAIDEYQLSLDVQRISSAYQRRGFLSVKVEPRVERKGDAATLIFKITEGPQAKATVDITGLPPEVSIDEARALVPLEDGAYFSYAAYDAGKAPILALVENAGYAHAQLDASVLANPANNRAILRYAIDPGPRVTYGSIEVVGADGPLAEAIRGRSVIQPGDTYSSTAIGQTQQAVYGIGLFTSVRVDVDRAGLATIVPVKITVAKAKQNELRMGGGLGLDTATYQARARISYSHVGWPSPLTKLGVELRPAYTVPRNDCQVDDVTDCDFQLRARLIGTVNQQDIFVRGLNGEVTGGLDYLTLEAYTMQGARLKVGLDLPLLLRRLHAQIGWQLLGYGFDSFNPALDETTKREIGVDHFARVGAFTQGVSIDFRDDPVSPKLGAYAEVQVAEGSAFAASAYDYVQVRPDVRGYVPIGRAVLAGRARLGVITGDVPPTERYYGGGAASQRGFAERRLSPFRPTVATPDLDPVVIGGAASFETGVELRAQFNPFASYKLGVVVFLDGADVTETTDQLDVGNLHWAVGIGIRPYYFPVGPLRFELGYRLNRTGAGEPQAGQRWNYVISLGEAF